jgi:hypothetical protein
LSRRVNRNRRAGRAPSGGALPWMLSLPARMHLRWLVILVVLVAALGAYARVLATAGPMPPGKAPVVGTTVVGTPVAGTPVVGRTSPSEPSVPSTSPTPTSRVG